jgi:hypothetical protein
MVKKNFEDDPSLKEAWEKGNMVEYTLDGFSRSQH